ncbi:hypothetical protein AVEN_221892-1 [Araneus ventricosus]|uniref:Retrotransposon gag domain-containing protein n=1 Tax=Araneus ventricosus TaxID=182803 RepID=A0A4Y2LSG7_ARAVE|nr:hypothetical protein AVEN_221892-1 [Araneus ventricosus]
MRTFFRMEQQRSGLTIMRTCSHHGKFFQTELKKVFGDTQLFVRRAKDILKYRAQKSGESTQSYIQDVLGLCHQIDSNMPEDDKISHLMKGGWVGRLRFNGSRAIFG